MKYNNEVFQIICPSSLHLVFSNTQSTAQLLVAAYTYRRQRIDGNFVLYKPIIEAIEKRFLNGPQTLHDAHKLNTILNLQYEDAHFIIFIITSALIFFLCTCIVYAYNMMFQLVFTFLKRRMKLLRYINKPTN